MALSLCAFAQAAGPADTNVSSGVQIGEPVSAVSIDVDLRDLPVTAAWKPGMPIKEAHKRQFFAPNRPDAALPAWIEAAPDRLPELQRMWDDSVVGQLRRGLPQSRVSINNASTGVSPGDPVVDVSANHIMYGVNGSSGTSFTIYDKTGTKLAGPTTFSSLAPAGDGCRTSVSDPIILFDRLANRWFLLEMGGTSSAAKMCIYVSKTENPVSGGWWFYGFSTPALNDYPHCGVWNNAYVCTDNEGGSNVAVYAYDRANMLNGATARAQQRFATVPALAGYGFQALTPATFMGDSAHAPPASTRQVLVRHNDDEAHAGGSANTSQDFIDIYTINVDWNTPANSAITAQPDIAITEFNSWFRDYSTFATVPQPGSTSRLDPIREVILNSLVYRNLGSHESIVGQFATNQNAARSGTVVDAGIRWFELRRTGGVANAWTKFQEGTYAPSDPEGATNRWMGATAMDSAGNIAMGFSIDRAVGASPMFPSLAYVGRQNGDPAGVMTTAETRLVTGGSSQTNFDRWGDYFQLGVDPADGCTFWFTGQYMAASNWATRVASFRFDACGSPTFSLSGTPLDQAVCAATPSPVALTPVNITVGSIAGFNTPVSLGFGSGLPAGFGGSYTTNPVVPPGSSQANLTVTNAATPGLNALTLRGSAAGTDRDLALNVTVATQAPAAATLTAPANNAVNVSATPTFTWTASAQSASYLIEIATDAGFSNIILSQSVSGTSFQPAAALPTNTQIYWRVTPNNICGAGTPSAVFTFFTQAAPGDCSAGTFTTPVFTDDMESGTPGWTHSAAVGTDTWAVITTRPNSPVNSWRGVDSTAISDQRLVSPTVVLPTTLSALNLQFQHWRNIEANGATACYDAGILEVSLNGGAFTQVTNAQIAVGDYTGAVSGSFSNPLAGLQGWCGSVPYNNVVVDISAFAGQNAQFRFRLGSDASVGREGWYIDDFKVQGCSASDLIFADGFDPP